MPDIEPQAARAFAFEVVRRLRDAGYEALWAGGCVRDQLRGHTPKDYDVATGATPDQVRDVFGRRRTVSVGAAFGVITVIGPREAGQVEVATFRCDAGYSDGRHPDGVQFSDARADALRRDFTVNGLFWDPVNQEVIDYVGGQQDLAARVIRAIRDPHQRFAEDKLRMLRAVRFAAAMEFSIEPATCAAICEHAAEVSVVSAERIAEEFRLMLTLRQRRRAAELLHQTGLLVAVLSELQPVADPRQPASATWQRTLEMLDALAVNFFSAALSILLRSVPGVAEDVQVARSICRRWRLSNRETEEVCFCLAHETMIRNALSQPWSQLQRVLVQESSSTLLAYAAAVAAVCGWDRRNLDYCYEQLGLPPEQLDPLPLVTGDDLREAGFTPGPLFGKILEAIRNAQLDGHVTSRQEALSMARQIADSEPSF